MIKVFAPAKINLMLEVLNRRENGYHSLEMIMQSVSLHDIVNITINNTEEICVSCNKDIGSSLENNTAYKAAKIFIERLGKENIGVNIVIEKNIPAQAGLAGGSADGAATLVGLNKLFDDFFSNEEILHMAELIGSDVPFCVGGGAMLATGTGTQLTKINNMPECFIVLAKPEVGVSTKQAYKLCDDYGFENRRSYDYMISAIENDNIYSVAENLFNRFENVMKLDEIDYIKRVMVNNGALNACMTGSGSAVFGIFCDGFKARKCCDNLKKEFREVFLCTPIPHGCKIIK